ECTTDAAVCPSESEMPNAKRTPPAEKRPTGPEPETLKIEGYPDWEDAVRDGLKKEPPPGGWPKGEPKKKGGRG
ncbi:MAG: hypothetical protein WKG32_10265, partial [Gemmatimonadaceae bacterium]